MEQYISKSAVVAEIKRKIHNIDYEGLSDRNIGQKQSLYHILSFLDTLETKEVDLEKEIQSWIEDNSVNGYYQEDVYETAEHFYELGLKAQKGE